MLSCITLFAQTSKGPKPPRDKFKVDWGKEFKGDSRTTADNIIGTIGEYTYVLKLGKKETYSIDKVDENLYVVKNVELKLKYNNTKLVFEELLMFNEKMYLVTSVKDKKKKVKSLYYQVIDNTLLDANEEPEKLSEINYESGNSRNSGSFGFKTSEDRSKLLIFYNLPFDKGEKEKFGFHVYDDKLGQIWERNIKLPYEEELFNIDHYNIDNAGNIYVVGKLYKEKAKDQRRGKPNYEYRLISYLQNEEERNEYKIALPDIFLREMNVVSLDNGDFQCVGFYSVESSNHVKSCYVL